MTGYRGRFSIVEVLRVTPEVERSIGANETADKIADIAGQLGARVIAARPEALDLASVERKGWDMVRACREWLEKNADD